MNRLKALEQYGQSFWLDDFHNELVATDELRTMIEQDGLKGITSNSVIFEKAVESDRHVRSLIQSFHKQNMNARAIYEQLAVREIRYTAHRLQPVYVKTAGRDGYVSWDVSPHLAYDTEGMVLEARRLWHMVAYDILMIKIPGTPEGIAAIRKLIAEGINVNATLIFSRKRYQQVADAYLTGLEHWMMHGGDPAKVASLASFFVSPIDTEMDVVITACLMRVGCKDEQALLKSLLGKVAIANAKLAYEDYLQICDSRRWQALASGGAMTQRLLWTSTEVRNPDYRDVMYVEELIGQETVTTVPPATVAAFHDHGIPRSSLEENVDDACRIIAALECLDISLEEVTDRLLQQHVDLFEEALDASLTKIRREKTDSTTGISYHPLESATGQ